MADGVTTENRSIGIIIPTCNRSSALVSCLQHLERQSCSDFEVVVVDDGSTDDTLERLDEYRKNSPLQLRVIRQENSGPARARNQAIAQLRSPICLMIGDDIFASPEFVHSHLIAHEKKPQKQLAVVGLTRWSDSGQTVTPFMRWLEDSGVQFSYKDLLEGAKPDWKHFYTSNLSVKTELLREFPFNESFRKAAAEDIELGYRIHRSCGLEVEFQPEALAHHLHPTDFRQACRRNITVGASMRLFDELWPDAWPANRSLFSPARRLVRDLFVKNPRLLQILTTLAETATSLHCPNPLMRNALICYYRLGYVGGSEVAAQSI